MNVKTDSAKNMGKIRSQRGAALITVLFLSTLLLATGGALILVTSTATRTAVDSTAEMQAYYGAEAGLEYSLNVLRGNVAPNAAMPAGTKISFRNAVTLSESNLPSDTSTTYRLSAWLNYNYTPAGAPNPDRVTLTAGYTPITGLAYSVDVSDPDGISPPDEPSRLLLRVTGYGPKGALKRLELVVKRTNFDYEPRCMLCVRSSDNGTPVTFDIGDSAAKDYSGSDHWPTGVVLPTFGATSSVDMNIQATADTKATVATPEAATLANSSLPAWLQSADAARALLAELKVNAIEQGRYFSSFDGYAGTTASPKFTFVDGDCTLDGGAGLLIVTGNLEMNGNPNFNGVLLVLGGGTVNRDGGGNGNVYGAMAIASFPRTGNGGFTASTFHTNGSGTSTMQFDSNAVRQALNMGGPRVLGVHEY